VSFPPHGRERCDFFMWVEDNPALVALEVEPGGESGQDWVSRQKEIWRQRCVLAALYGRHCYRIQITSWSR
jgi:hypothetical protein